jgi:hypothetical protein
MAAALEPFQRGERGAKAGDQFGGDVEPVVVDQPAWIAAVQLGARGAEGGERAHERVTAGTWARAAQQRVLERRDGGVVRAFFGAEPQQRMLEQREQRHRLEPAEGRFGGEPREHAGRRFGKRVAAGIVDRHMPALERGGDAAG